MRRERTTRCMGPSARRLQKLFVRCTVPFSPILPLRHTHTHTYSHTHTHTHVLPPPKESQPLLLNKGKTQYTECQDTHTFNHHRRSTPRDHGKIGNDYHHH